MPTIERDPWMREEYDFLAGYRIFPFIHLNSAGEYEIDLDPVIEEIETVDDAAAFGRYFADAMVLLDPYGKSKETAETLGIEIREDTKQEDLFDVKELIGVARVEIYARLRESNPDFLRAFLNEYMLRAEAIPISVAVTLTYAAELGQISQLAQGRANFSYLEGQTYLPLRPPGHVPERTGEGHLIWYDADGAVLQYGGDPRDVVSRGARLNYVPDHAYHGSPHYLERFLEYIYLGHPRWHRYAPSAGSEPIFPDGGETDDLPDETDELPQGEGALDDGPSPFDLGDEDGGFTSGGRVAPGTVPNTERSAGFGDGDPADPPWDTTPVNPDMPWFPSQNPARLLSWSEWETWTGPERAAAPAWAMAADLGVWAEFGWTALDPRLPRPILRPAAGPFR